MMERINKTQSRNPKAYRISFVAFDGDVDDEYDRKHREFAKDRELPSWVKCDSDVIGVMFYLKSNSYNEDVCSFDFEDRVGYNPRLGVLQQLTPYDVCRAFKDEIEYAWDLNKDYKDLINSRLAKFKNHTLTLDDGTFDIMYEVNGYVGYYTRPNGDVVDVNLDIWESDTKNRKF